MYTIFYIKLFIIELRACKKECERENLKSHTMMLTWAVVCRFFN